MARWRTHNTRHQRRAAAAGPMVIVLGPGVDRVLAPLLAEAQAFIESAIARGFYVPPALLSAGRRFYAGGETVASMRRCWACGCTDARACPGGCSWVEADLCSGCAAPHP